MAAVTLAVLGAMLKAARLYLCESRPDDTQRTIYALQYQINGSNSPPVDYPPGLWLRPEDLRPRPSPASRHWALVQGKVKDGVSRLRDWIRGPRRTFYEFLWDLCHGFRISYS